LFFLLIEIEFFTKVVKS